MPMDPVDMERGLRTATPRSCREAFGQDLPPEVFDGRQPSRTAGAIALAVAIIALVAAEQSRQHEVRDLIGNRCKPIGQTVAGETVWACDDGMRVSPVAAM